MITVKKGLNLPINGQPEQVIDDPKPVSKVALIGPDYPGMKPDFAVAMGEMVKIGQLLFTDKKMPAIRFTSPGSGRVIGINRGEKRVFLSIVIELSGDAEITYQSYQTDKLVMLDRETIIAQLLESGLWTALRSRPFERIANPEDKPHSIFINAMDTNPLAADPATIIRQHSVEFISGMQILLKLTDGSLYLCKAKDADIPVPNVKNLKVEVFQGPHPAGNVGTHIHFLDPVHRGKIVWHLGAQEVIAVGHLFSTGRLLTERVISLAGPGVKKPRLVKTRLGASIMDITKNELTGNINRLISGSVLSGTQAQGELAFLGRYHQQVTVIPEGGKRKFFGWLSPGSDLYSVKNIVISRLFRARKFDFNTDLNGGVRAIVPIGSYEKVMPLDILPTFLLRALAVDDIDESEKLGCLELAEEDLALCTYVCPSKIEHDQNLRRVLTLIEKEG